MKGVVVHCSDSTFGNNILIDEWHRERGFDNVGYHFVICNGQIENNRYFAFMDGAIETGRDLDKNGAHARGYNNHIGICLIGVDKFTVKQFEALAFLLGQLRTKYDFSTEDILFHYEISDKACPNFNKEWFFNTYML